MGPRLMCCVVPRAWWTSVAWKFWIMPAETRTRSRMTAIGARIRNVIRTGRPEIASVGVRVRAGELVAKTADEDGGERDREPTAADRIVLGRRDRDIWVDVRHRRLARVSLPVGVRHKLTRCSRTPRHLTPVNFVAPGVRQVRLDALKTMDEDEDR